MFEVYTTSQKEKGCIKWMTDKPVEPNNNKARSILKITFWLTNESKKEETTNGEENRSEEQYPRNELIPHRWLFKPHMRIKENK